MGHRQQRGRRRRDARGSVHDGRHPQHAGGLLVVDALRGDRDSGQRHGSGDLAEPDSRERLRCVLERAHARIGNGLLLFSGGRSAGKRRRFGLGRLSGRGPPGLPGGRRAVAAPIRAAHVRGRAGIFLARGDCAILRRHMFNPPPGTARSNSRRAALTVSRRYLGALGILGLVAAAAGGLSGLGIRVARADRQSMVKYVGMHPLPPHQGQYCFIDEVHYHRFLPVDLRVYVKLKDNGHLYVGDPAWLGYDGPKVGYFRPHPLAVPLASEAGPLFCYIAGPDYHAIAPAASPHMLLKDGVYWYLGPPPPVDVPRSWINEVHAIKGYVAPPVNLSAAPPGYHVF